MSERPNYIPKEEYEALSIDERFKAIFMAETRAQYPVNSAEWYHQLGEGAEKLLEFVKKNYVPRQ